ncbi:MAG: hypothetical protein IPN29_12005 [Saprospiraceae bacterium]|nr:hypothetical protein [Saprospiraceae bacterium]
MRLYMLMFCSLIVMLVSCKENGPTDKKTVAKTSQDTTLVSKNTKTPGSSLIAQWNVQANNILKFRKDNKPNNYAIIDVGVWEYEAAFKDGAMSKPGEYSGKWIDFDEHNRYEYGEYERVLGKGRYHYDNDTYLLLLVNDEPTVKPEEYELKLVNNIMIMMGNQTYQDNNMQAKLVKIQERPKKK